ncbi:MAG TPA: two-component regulator propeller domain-containing protein [Bacteroidia bacterium]|nr:two-component regulator propeller domain-containing protein [Bacteroidia bacterium]
MMIPVVKSGAQSFDFISYGVEEGLSQSEARCVMQDTRGYLWTGTAGGGVCSYDGIKFTEYGKKDGLPGQVVNCLAEDSAGNIWIGTSTGVAFYDGKIFNHLIDNRQLESGNISSLAVLKDRVLIGTGDGIFQYSGGKKMASLFAYARNVNGISVGDDGTVWATSASTLWRISNGKCDSIPLPAAEMLERKLTCVTTDHHGLVYIGTDHGLLVYRVSTGTFNGNTLSGTLGGDEVSALFAAADGTVWAGTMNNLVVKFAPDNSFVSYDRSNGLDAEAVFGITVDDTKHLWLATKEQSLVYLRSESFSYYGNLKGMGSVSVFRIMEDHEGHIWTGSKTDGLYEYDGKTTHEVLNGSRPFEQPFGIAEDKNHVIWVGHLNGVTGLVNGKAVKQLIPGVHVRTLMCDSKGNLWIGTWGSGLFFYDGHEMKNYTVSGGQIPQDYVHSLLEDHLGNIWIGTGNGLCRYDGKRFRTYGVEDGLCNTYIGSLAEDQYGNIWFHTDACIQRFDGRTFRSYDEGNGLASSTYYFVACDAANQLWVGSNKGIDRVKIDEFGNFLSVKNYSRNEGFRGIECNSRAVCVGSDKTLWFGTVKGVIRYFPSFDYPDNVEPRTHITGIRLFLEPTDWTWSGIKESGWYHLPEKLVLNFDQNHLTFLYEGVHLGKSAEVSYKFMLAGFDSAWQPVTFSKEITYANLPPGSYRFMVLAANPDGKWNSVPATSCNIVILPPPPPFYMNWWFIGIAALLVTGILYYVIVGRTRRIMAQKEKLEAEVRERTNEISRQNEEKTLMLKEIHHRVKNNLQVISSLLNLQADGITDKHMLALFEDLRHRVNSMALIHEKMYQSRTLVNIDIQGYIRDLISSLIDAYDSNKNIHTDFDVEEITFRIDTIVPLGLILNEIISNSLKYAFEGRSGGNLSVRLHRTGAHSFRLEVGDDGVGMPADFDLEKTDSLGIQLIHMLCDQVNGKISMTTDKGTHYTIDFSEDAKDRF